MFNILICDDEKDIVNALAVWLACPEYRLLTAFTGREAVEVARQEDLQLILLDIMMPQEDGLHAMQRIRAFSNVPIILLTAKSQDEDKVEGLLAGADDYITKPFNPKEVQARVRSQLRRYTQLGGGTADPEVLRLGGLELDDRAKSVSVDGEAVNLTRKEYDILKLLMAHPGKVFAPAEIYRKVWKEEPLGGDNTVAVHIRHLREKIEIDPGNPRYVRLVFGQGYVAEKGGLR